MNESQARQWILEGLQWMAKGATLTPTTVDDKGVAIAITAIESNTLWGWVWKFVGPAFEGDMIVGCDEMMLAMASEEAPDELKAMAAEVGIDPITIIALIMAILDFIKSRRK